MRKLTATAILAAGMALGGEMTGWISDASCGAANAKPDAASRECTRNCLKGGAAPVFVSDNGGKVFKLAGKVDAAKTHVDYKVKIKGQVKGDTLTVESVGKAD
ncbi:MAG TPA: hypothetical protein VES20_08125 [Bryobacteraceae bacterium]|nr:hypothetical protein [Bryobacteraceae bacterium]